MTHDQDEGRPDMGGFAAPPVSAGELEQIKPPEQWPMVIGVLGIVFGALGVVLGICGIAGTLFGSAMMGMMPEEQAEDAAAQMQMSTPYPVLQGAVQVLEMVLAIVLLIGSIQLLRRSRGAVGVLKGYAWADLVANLIGAGVGVLVGLAQMEAMKSDPDLADDAGAVVGLAMIVLAVVGFVLSCIWPVFLLIWFGRAKIREQVAGWGGGDGFPGPAA